MIVPFNHVLALAGLLFLIGSFFYERDLAAAEVVDIEME